MVHSVSSRSISFHLFATCRPCVFALKATGGASYEETDSSARDLRREAVAAHLAEGRGNACRGNRGGRHQARGGGHKEKQKYEGDQPAHRRLRFQRCG